MPLLTLKNTPAPQESPKPFAAIHALQTANALRVYGNPERSEQQASWAEIARRTDNEVDPELGGDASLLATCMNPDCNTNWLRVWRPRQQPRFEGQWACSAECMRELLGRAVEREMGDDVRLAPQPHRHRVPLGLVLLSQGWITGEQLRAALEAQRSVGKGRIGAWLARQCGLSEERITRALCMQWGCPMFPLAGHQPSAVATLIPRLLLDTYGVLPLRITSGRVAYLAFEDRIDAVVAHAAGRMNGLRTETGLLRGSQYLRGHERMMAAAFPKSRVVEVTDTLALTKLLSDTIERLRPHQARLVRMHRYFWLRCWRTAMAPASASPMPLVPRIHQVEDLLVGYGSPKE